MHKVDCILARFVHPFVSDLALGFTDSASGAIATDGRSCLQRPFVVVKEVCRRVIDSYIDSCLRRARKRSITRLCDKALLCRTSKLAAVLRSLPVSLGSRGRCSAAVGLVSVNLSRFLALSYLGFSAFRVADDGAHRT